MKVRAPVDAAGLTERVVKRLGADNMR
jgi:hypothetical protein